MASLSRPLVALLFPSFSSCSSIFSFFSCSSFFSAAQDVVVACLLGGEAWIVAPKDTATGT
ncbi:hypothetical protein ACFVZM_08185 [Streptomyces sioyaensis]|uniref:hypothetical protein n=1 Tax=Streptomyces sioyaensis TaxID=67364 RepID=UPI00368BE978